MSHFILHCDLDCFFAAVEERDNPIYIGKPIVIGADPKEGKGRGVVSTCNYEARKFGLHSAMPISQAYKRCPHGIYLHPNFDKYHKASKEVMEIVNSYSDMFQQVSIDEAYLDVSDKCINYIEVRDLAEKLKDEVQKKVGITISIGCASTKSIAKIASDRNKPNGITVVEPEKIKLFLKDLDITRIPGIGKKSKLYYNKKGINTIGDIINTPLHKMIQLFGKNGKNIWYIVNGLDNNKTFKNKRIRNSISKERTFIKDTNNFYLILSELNKINELINIELKQRNIFYRTITLKIRLGNYSTYTRSKTFYNSIQDKNIAMKTILPLYEEFHTQNKEIRLIGIKFSNLTTNIKSKQLKIQNFV